MQVAIGFTQSEDEKKMADQVASDARPAFVPGDAYKISDLPFGSVASRENKRFIVMNRIHNGPTEGRTTIAYEDGTCWSFLWACEDPWVVYEGRGRISIQLDRPDRPKKSRMVCELDYALLLVVAILGWSVVVMTAGRVMTAYERGNWLVAMTFYGATANVIGLVINGLIFLRRTS
jgi:hypothetical protein